MSGDPRLVWQIEKMGWTIGQQRAEIERLTRERDVAAAERETAREARYAANDEIDRLRAALKEIVQFGEGRQKNNDDRFASNECQIAVAALADQQSAQEPKDGR